MSHLLKLDDEMTFWVPTGNNGTGGKTWTVGAKTDAKLADTNEIVNEPNGKQIKASKTVFSKVDTPVGSYVIEGDQSGFVEPTDDAQQVIKFIKNPLTELRNALLL